MNPYHRGVFIFVTAVLSGALNQQLFAETIIKLNLGATGPDVKFEGGVLSTVIDAGRSELKKGDQDTTANFDGFIKDQSGIMDISPPAQATFTLTGVGLSVDDPPIIVDQGGVGLVTQATTGGSFSLYDEFGGLLLTGTLDSGSLHGTIGPSGTGGFLTANLGTFTGPSSSDTGPSGSAFNQLFKLVDPGSAALAVSLTDVVSIDPVSGPIPGFLVVNGEMQRFTADATANVGASQVPEPGTLSLLLVGVVGAMLMGSRRVLAG